MYCNVLGWMDRRGNNKEAASCRARSLAILDLAPFFDYFPQGRPRHSRSMCSRSTAARPRISLAAHLGAHSHSLTPTQSIILAWVNCILQGDTNHQTVVSLCLWWLCMQPWKISMLQTICRRSERRLGACRMHGKIILVGVSHCRSEHGQKWQQPTSMDGWIILAS